MDFWISDWISGFHSGFLDFSLDFWISGFQFGFLQTVYEISFVTNPSTPTRKRKYEEVRWSLVPASQFVARVSLLFAFPSSAFSVL